MAGNSSQPPPRGTFGPDGYAALLSDLFRQRATGLLVLVSGATVKKLYLGDGYILYGSSNVPADRLGDILLAKGIINREQYDGSVRLIKETGKKQGTLLVQMGAINPRELFRGLILQVTEIAESPFLWPEGSYSLSGEYNKEEEMIILKINPGNVIREGLWRIPPSDDPFPMARGSFLRRSDSPFLPEELTLSPLEKKILSGGKIRTPADVSSSTGIPLKVVAKSYDVLSRLGLLATAQEAPATKEEDALLPPEPGGDVSPRSAGEETDFRKELVAFHQRLPRLTYYQVLGVESDVPGAEIKRAYIRKAKEYHPDRFMKTGLDDLAPLAGEIFMRINEAYGVLSDDNRRREYHRAAVGVGEAPPGKGGSDLALASEQFKKGMRLLKCGEANDAAEAFRWAARLNPRNPLYHCYLGVALMETGRRLKEAEEHLKTAIALDYNNPEFYVNLGLVYKKGKVLEQAAESFRRALSLDPRHPGALREMEQLPKARRQPPERDSSILGRLFGK